MPPGPELALPSWVSRLQPHGPLLCPHHRPPPNPRPLAVNAQTRFLVLWASTFTSRPQGGLPDHPASGAPRIPHLCPLRLSLPWPQPSVPFFFPTYLLFAIHSTITEAPWGQAPELPFPLVSCHCRDISLLSSHKSCCNLNNMDFTHTVVWNLAPWRKLDTWGFLHILFQVLMVKSLKTVKPLLPYFKSKVWQADNISLYFLRFENLSLKNFNLLRLLFQYSLRVSSFHPLL